MNRRNIYLVILAGTCLCFGDVKADPPVNPPVTCVSLRQLIDECNAEIASLEQQLLEANGY